MTSDLSLKLIQLFQKNNNFFLAFTFPKNFPFLYVFPDLGSLMISGTLFRDDGASFLEAICKILK